jgi:cell division protein FtsI/penicillin-binding protein 2
MNADQSTKWPKLNPTDQLEKGTIELINVAGKTGTAEFGVPDNIGAADSHAWFTCYAPIEEPEIAVAVIIEAGGEGSSFAVPVADAVLRGYFEMTGRRERGVVLGKDPLPV